MDALTFRKGTRSDLPRIAELVAGDPGNEAIGLLSGRETARRFGMGLYRFPPLSSAWKQATLAELNGEVVGVIQVGAQEMLKASPSLVFFAVRTLGPVGVVRGMRRLKARDRVNARPPAGACHITELNVDSRHRGCGIGGELLDHAEADARNADFRQMSLSTTTSNPARHLYERHGFRVIETKTDAEYERFTGIAGRLLMTKDLA